VAQRSSVHSGSPSTLMSSPTSALSHHRSDDAQRPPPPPPQPSPQRPELPSRTVARGVRSGMGAGAVNSAFLPVAGGHRSGAPGIGPRPAAGRAVAAAVAAESTGSRGDTAVAAAVAAPWQQQQQPRSNAVGDGTVVHAGDDGTVVRESAAARREGGTGQQQLTSTVDSCLRAANAQAKRWFEELDVNGDGGLDQHEFQELAARLGLRSVSRARLAKAFEQCDVHGEGTIGFTQFSQWWGMFKEAERRAVRQQAREVGGLASILMKPRSQVTGIPLQFHT
jgi:hypothetical protein